MEISIKQLPKLYVFILLGFVLIYSILVSKSSIQVVLLIPPIIYLFGYIGISKIHKYLKFPGMFLINIISFIRYYLIPVLMISTLNFYDSSSYLYKGVWFLIYESIIIFIILNVIIRKTYENLSVIELKKNFTNENNLIKIVILIALIIVINQPSVLEQYNFVFKEMNEISFIKQSELITGMSALIFNIAKLFTPVILIFFVYRIRNQNIFYVLSIVILLIFNVLFFSGTSRNSVVIPAVATMFFLIKFFESKKNATWILFLITIVTILIQLTITKNQYINSNALESMSGVVKYLDIYFSGPNNLGIAIKAKDLYGDEFTYKTLFNDLFSNAPLISSFTDMSNRTSTFFNLSFYNGGLSTDQIIPSNGQGLFYFGYVFSIVPQILVIISISFFDKLFAKTSNVLLAYLLAYFAARFGFGYTQNISTLINFALAVILPAMLIYQSNELINNKFRLFTLEKKRLI